METDSLVHELKAVRITVVDEEGSSDEDDNEDSKLTAARNRREKYRSAIVKRNKELFAIQERLYTVRWDESRSTTDTQHEVRNLVREVVRLRTIINALYDKEMHVLEEQVDLGALDMPPLMSSSEYAPAVDATLLAASVSNALDSEIDTLEQQKFMRTKSTQTLSNKPADVKWQALRRMFGEWRAQTAVAQAQEVVSKPSSKNSDDDIVALRSAIHHLRQKKELSARDRQLLAKMQRRLEALVKGPGTLCRAGATPAAAAGADEDEPSE